MVTGFTFVNESDQVSVPAWVADLESFRRWTDSEDFPEEGRICYLRGEVWIDMSKEQLFSHNQVRTEYTRVLAGLAKAERLGRYFDDGAYLSSIPADLSVVPDGIFVATESLRTGRVRPVEGREAGFVELEGSPDMALEVVSDSSVHKDTVELFRLYWEAGIQEYWLVDARREPLRFDIFRHTAKGYVATRKQGGWLKSAVFGKSFRLTQDSDELGHPSYTLEIR
jgi:Uma2 family endonuclease